MSESTTFISTLRQEIEKRLAEYTVGTLALLLSAVVVVFGDRIFDSVQNALGKRGTLQLVVFSVCAAIYSLWLVYDRLWLKWDSRLGLFRHRKLDEFYCPSCRSPLKTETEGWRCKKVGCLTFCSNPDYKSPPKAPRQTRTVGGWLR